jgi:ankyrin repeat protein
MSLRPNLDDKNGFLTSILSRIAGNHPEYIEDLLDKGAKVDGSLKVASEESFYRYTPLHVAIMTENEALARLLISKGADISWSPLGV